MGLTENAAITMLELLEETVMNEHTVKAVQRIIYAWRKEEEAHNRRVATLELKERSLCDRVEALKVLKKELEEDVSVLRQTYQAQLMTALDSKSTAWDESQANFVRAARLLIEPGKAITDQTLTALGLTPPRKGVRPTEHWVRSVCTTVLPCLGFHVLHSQSGHPDLICDFNGQTIGVEVEVGLRDYNAHGHDAADAHMVAVWQNPSRIEINEDGYFVAAKCTQNFSPRLSVITLQTPNILGSLHDVGAKRALKFQSNA